MKLKIAIVVHGRFHAFDLARALLQRGHEVILFTNYPKWAVERFGVPKTNVRNFWVHSVLTRINWWLHQKLRIPYLEQRLHKMFGRWAAAQIKKEHWDVVHCWSGVSEETLRALEGTNTLRLLMRGSAHIITQTQILEEEERRTRTRIDRPSPWMIAREEREYAQADCIRVLSSFAFNSFITEGVSPAKICLIPSGVSVEAFRLDPEVVESRCLRIISGEPLRILYVGALSFRKGIWDIANILLSLKGERFRFRFVGPVAAEAEYLLAKLRHLAEFIPKQPQQELSDWYAWGDLFVFPTIEEGYPQVLAQAHASGLPILTTTNSSGPDFISDGKTGWVLPIRNPGAFIEKLIWCDEHRLEIANMVRRIYHEFKPRDWLDVASDFELFCIKTIKKKAIRQLILSHMGH